MSGDWERVKRVFQVAIESDPAVRQAVVEQLCGGDEQLRADVDSLLESHAAAGSFADRPAEELLAALADVDADDRPLRRLSPDDRLGHYRIVAPIASGGMGDVYEARDTRLDRTVALKVLRAGTTGLARERFAREARAVGQLSHPHICALHDVGHHEGVDFLVMERLAGETLASRLTRGPLSWQHALDVGIQLASALDCAHRAGIVHRDLKPGNVFLVGRVGTSAPPVVKLLDFGLAKPASGLAKVAARRPAATNDHLTGPGAFIGTVGYMAPEQLEGRPVDARTDVFALGVVLYEAIAGHPFDDSSDARAIADVLEHEPPALSSLRTEVPSAVDRIVATCLAKDPDERWQTAPDLQRAMTWVRDGAFSVPTSAFAGNAVRRWLMLSGAMVALTVVVIAGWADWRRPVVPTSAPVTFPLYAPAGTRFPRGAAEIAVAPDGRRLAFVALSPDGVRRVWVRDVAEIEAGVVNGTEDAAHPFWSPDGQSIGFFANGSLKRIPASGGIAHVLCQVGLGGQGGAWSPAGVIVFSSYGEGVRRIPDTGGEPQPVTVPNARLGESTHAWPTFLPDGRHFLYLARSSDPSQTAIYEGDVDSAETRRILSAESRPGFAAGYIFSLQRGALSAQPFDTVRHQQTGAPITIATAIAQDSPLRSGGAFAAGADPTVLAYRSASPDGRLRWVDRRGRITEVEAPPGDYQNPSLSPDEQRIAVERTDPSTGRHTIWVVNERRGLTARLVADRAGAHMPVWSPDGKRIAFNSNRRGGVDLYAVPADGPDAPELLLASSDGKAFIPMDWSHDGRQLLYTAGPAGLEHLWILPLRPGQNHSVRYATAGASAIQAQFSPDGRWIAYASRETGSYEVYVRHTTAPERRWQVSTRGGAQPRWRQDGRELFYLAPDGDLMAVDVTIAKNGLETGGPHALFNTGIAASFIDRRNQYVVARNGQRFLVNVSAEDEGAAPITVILNWQPTAR